MTGKSAHKPFAAVVAALSVILCLPFLALAQDEERAAVRGYLFYSGQCPECDVVRTSVLPPLYREYGQQLRIMAIDVSTDAANQQWLAACEQEFDASGKGGTVPAVFIADRYLVGSEAIEGELAAVIDANLESGAQYPDVPRPGGPLEPHVRFMFFFSPTCPHCEDVKEEVFPKIEEKYGPRVEWEAHDISQPTDYQALLVLGELARLPAERQGAVPMVFIGDDYSLYAIFVGGTDIAGYLGSAIEWYMEVGGVDLPDWHDELFRVAATPFPQTTVQPGSTQATETPETSTPTRATDETPSGAEKPIHMAYFGEVGCSECDRVSIALEHLKERFPSLVVTEFDIVKHLSINLCLSDALDVPENQRHNAPAVFVGSDYLVDKDIQYDALVQMVSRYTDMGAEPIWADCGDDVELPPPPPWWAVILPGLADGINPCAFATIIFFVSYLSIIQRKGQDVIMVGVSFALAVFLSYLGFGMVLREVFAGLIGLVGPILRPILNVLTAGLCAVLAVLSFGDFRKARRGEIKDMALQLPHKLRMWINATIRKSMRSETLVAASFASGVVVSFVELACTGQVYVPIIQGLSNPAYRAQSTLDLLVYCLAFVAPLVVVFVLSYMGTTSKELTRFFDRYAAPVKLVMTLLFLTIGVWLIYDVLRVWGVFSPLFVSASS